MGKETQCTEEKGEETKAKKKGVRDIFLSFYITRG